MPTISKASLLLCPLFVVSTCSFTAGGQAKHAGPEDAAIFTLGRLDRSSTEFSGSSAESQFHVREAHTIDASAWKMQQAAGETHTREIHFELAAKQALRLHVAVLLEDPSVPRLRVGINGTWGDFALAPALDYSDGDLTGQGGDLFNVLYSHADLVVDLPAEAVHVGDNVLSLTVMAPPSRRSKTGSVFYDFVSLFPARGSAPARPIDVTPTIFYTRSAAGEREQVDVLVPQGAYSSGENLTVRVGANDYDLPVSSSGFGDILTTIEVPAFSAKTSASLVESTKHGRSAPLWKGLLDPAKKWTVLLCPLVHLDVGFTDNRAVVAATHTRTIAEALELMGAHPEFRFNIDGFWPVEQFLTTRTHASTERAIAAMRDGKLGVPGQYANILTGFPTAEVLIRSLYPAANFAREHGTPFDYVNMTDNPTYSWSYASVLASAGIHDFIAASNSARAPVLLQGHLNMASPFQWQGPDGASVTMWDSRHYEQMRYLFGVRPEASAGRESLPLFLSQYSRPDYTASTAIVYGSQMENTDLNEAYASVAEEWNKTYTFPRLEYATLGDALRRVESETRTMATVRGDGAPYWEEGLISDSAATALERETERRAPSAEKLSMLTPFLDPTLRPQRDALSAMWRSMLLMDEHTVTLSRGVTDPEALDVKQQLEQKRGFARDAADQAEGVTTRSLATLLASRSHPDDTVVVFNTLNWKRDGVVEADITPGSNIVDTRSGALVFADQVSAGSTFRRVRFLAREIPPMGYVAYKVVPASANASSRPEDKRALSTTVESPFYRVTLDPETGAVASIYDKELRQDLVSKGTDLRFGQYLYVTGGGGRSTSMFQYRPLSPSAELTLHPASHGGLDSVVDGQDWVRVKMHSSAINTPSITTELTLRKHEKRIDLTVVFDKNYTTEKEGVYIAFPFTQKSASFRYEVQNGVVDPRSDIYAGGGHEWFSVQNWASVEANGITGVVASHDAPLMAFGDINRGLWPETFGDRPGVMFSYVMANYRPVGHAAGQSGHFSFRYSITSTQHPTDAQLSHWGWNLVTPLETLHATRSEQQPLEQNQPALRCESFLKLDDSLALVETWKAAEDGDGSILRILDLGGAQRTLTVTMPGTVHEAIRTDSVERPLGPLAVANKSDIIVPIGPHQIITVRVK